MTSIKKLITVMAFSTTLSLSGAVISSFNSNSIVAQAKTVPNSYTGKYIAQRNSKGSLNGHGHYLVLINSNSITLKGWPSILSGNKAYLGSISKKFDYYFYAKGGSDPVILSKHNGKLIMYLGDGSYLLKK